VRSVFSDPVVLDPLEPNEVHQLLHALFRGDLRGLLKA
jgi:hypothetical protein